MRRLWRVVVYTWVAPSSAVGLVATSIAILQGGRGRWVDGVLEVTGPQFLRWLSRGAPVEGGIAAITLGHVVVGQCEVTLAETRAHERVHVRQYERWGPFFIPAYLLASAWMKARGKDPYLDNPFEVEAYAVDLGR